MDKKTAIRKHIDYTEDDLNCGMLIFEKLEKVTKFLLHLKEHKNLKFSYILLHSTKPNFIDFLNETKRNTDLSFVLSEDKGIFCLVCQETDVEGGYRFAERIMSTLDIDVNSSCDSYASVLFINTNTYKTEQILFKLIDLFSESKSQDPEWRKGQITYKSI